MLKNKYMNLSILLFFSIIFILTGCSEIKFIESEQSIKIESKLIELADGTEKIEIDSSISDVLIKTEDRKDISVKLETYKNGPELSVDLGDTIKIKSDREDTFKLNIGFSENSKMTIIIPEMYNRNLEIKVSTGDLIGESFELNKFNCISSTGDVYIDQLIANSVKLDSSTGDLDIKKLVSEKIEIQTSTGDVNLENVSGNIIGETSTGNVTISYKEYASDISYDLSTSDIELVLNNANPNFEIDAESSLGDVEFNIPLSEVLEKKANKVKGKVGKGLYIMKLDVSTGDIIIKK